MSQEHHRQRLSAALRMPEHTNLSITLHCLFSSFQRLVHCKVLVISSHHLHLVFLVAVADKVAYDVQQMFLLEYPSKERFIVSQRRRFIFPVLRFPFHISLLVGGDGSCSACYHVGYHIKAVVAEQDWYLPLIGLYLVECIIVVNALIAWRFQFYHHYRKSIQKHHYVTTFSRFLFHCPLVDDSEVIVLDIVEIYYSCSHVAIFAVLFILFVLNDHSVLQPFCERLVFLQQTASLNIRHGVQQVFNASFAELWIQSLQALQQKAIVIWQLLVSIVQVVATFIFIA